MTDHNFYEVLRMIGRPVTYYPSISSAFGDDIRCAVFLSNFKYWEGKQHDDEGWIYKSQSEIKKETGLGRYAQEQSRKKLKEFGVLEEKLIGKPPILHYKFNWQKMNEILNKHFAGEKPEKATVQDPILYRMKIAFMDFYLEETKTEANPDGISFEWPDGKESGIHWKYMRMLKDAFKKRIFEKKKKTDAEAKEEDITDEDIFNSWQVFLPLIPKRHRERNLTPALLYKNFSQIIIEISSNAKRNSQIRQSTASDYV